MNPLVLHDYQLTLANKLFERYANAGHGEFPGDGGRFIIHGPRRIGMGTILLYHTLSVLQYPHIKITHVSHNFAMAEANQENLMRIYYSTGYDKHLFVQKENRGTIQFANGSSIRFITLNSPESFQAHKFGDFLFVDNCDTIPGMRALLSNSKYCSQVVIACTGGLDTNGIIYKLYVDSMKGLNSFEYIKIPLEVVDDVELKKYSTMTQTMTSDLWNMECRMFPCT